MLPTKFDIKKCLKFVTNWTKSRRLRNIDIFQFSIFYNISHPLKTIHHDTLKSVNSFDRKFDAIIVMFEFSAVEVTELKHFYPKLAKNFPFVRIFCHEVTVIRIK